MNKGKILIRGKVKAASPVIIGSGMDDTSDLDVLKDRNGIPYIPATSFLGVLRHKLLYVGKTDEKEFEKFWGTNKKNKKHTSSYISCSDLMASEKDSVGIRDGIRIDGKTGIAAEGAKFDFESVLPGTEFNCEIEIDASENPDFCKKIAGTIISFLESGLSVGAKTNSGFGKLKLFERNVCFYDFSKKGDVIAWLKESVPHDDSGLFKEKFDDKTNGKFEIRASFEIKNSLIVRSYPDDPQEADTVHIKAGDTNVIPGTSLKGALRARAERIANTVLSEEIAKDFITCLFGDVERDEKGKEKRGGYSIPSRFMVDEVTVDNTVNDEIQTRIKIDRFTGGTIETALFGSVPLFPEKGKDTIKNFRIEIRDALDSQKGLALLILKDLWISDLAIGGEKNIGRGVLIGKSAKIVTGGIEISFSKPEEITNDDRELLQSFVDAFIKQTDNDEIRKRLSLYRSGK